MKKFSFDLLPLFMSLLFSGLWVFLGGLIYSYCLGAIWTPLLIAIYVTGLALSLFLAIVVSNILGKNAKPSSSAYTKTLITIGAIFLCTMLFEFLYELEPQKVKNTKPTSYIFLIDDSGSMSGNDPDLLRNDAIYDVLQDCNRNFPYAVYSFDDSCKQISPIAPASSASKKNYGFSNGGGGTDIIGAIEYVLNDIKNGRLQAGAAPRILLLSDGLSPDFNYNTIISECQSRNVSISTVGFGSADKYLLENIANDTNGAFVWVEDINNITNAMSSVASSYLNQSRNLLSYRPELSYSFWYGLLRTVFMLILGAGFILIKVFMFSTFDEKNIALYTFIVLAVLGATCLEVGINALGFLPIYMRTVMCVSFAFLLGSSKETEMTNFGTVKSWDASSGGMGGSFANSSDKWKF